MGWSEEGASAIAPIVENKLGRTVTNSRAVAEFFGKRHADVLRAIDALDCSRDFSQRNFALWETPHPTVAGRTVRHFDLTKDGFVFLAMGFTGPKAARFKEAYITRFNEMQEELRNSHRTAYLGQVECRVRNHPGIFIGRFASRHRIISCSTHSGPWSGTLSCPRISARLMVKGRL